MHLALIVDEERLAQEQPMLNRLCIGLIAEGVRVTRIVPQGLTAPSMNEGERRIALAARIETSMRVLPWMRRRRTQLLIDQLDDESPDVIHAVGREALRPAFDLADELEIPVLVDVWSITAARSAHRFARHPLFAGGVAACRGLAQAMSKSFDPAVIHLVPMGVSVPQESRSLPESAKSGHALSLAILGAGSNLQAYASLFAGLRQVLAEHSNLHAFLELGGPHELDIWKSAERHGLIGCVSTMNDAATYRRLISNCDAILMPERTGELRSILLEAMARGIPIFAAGDPILDMVVDDSTASHVVPADSGAWASAISRLWTSSDAGRALGNEARQFMALHHRSSDQVAMFHELIERVAGSPLRFPASRA